MSTKIYNGYKLPQMSLKELNEFSMRFREKAAEKAAELCAKFLAGEIAKMADDIHAVGEDVYIAWHVLYDSERNEERKKTLEEYHYRSPYLVARRKALERYGEIQKTRQRDPEIDFDSGAVYFPMRGKILALYRGEQEEIQELWEQEELVAPYGYWNNSDRPEDVAASQWKRRKLDWDIALPGMGVPMENGLIADFVKGFPNIINLHEKIAEFMPTLETRARNLAESQLTEKKMDELKKESGKEEDAASMTEGSRRYRATKKWLQNEGKQEWENETRRWSKILLPEITRDHLTMHFHELKQAVLAYSEAARQAESELGID